MQNSSADGAMPGSDSIASGQRRALIIALLLGIVAATIRIYGIGRWDIVYDENYTFAFARTRFLTEMNPTYYGLVTLSYTLFGVSEFSARLPALILGILGVPVFFWTWRSVIGERAAVLGGLLIVFSAWHLWYSQFSRFYSGLFLFGSLTYYFYFQAVRKDSIRHLLWSMAMGLVAVSFHFSALLALATCSTCSAVLAAFPRLRGRSLSRRVVRLHLIISALGACVAIPVVLWLFGTWISMQQFWGYGPVGAFLQLMKWLQIPIAACTLIGIVHLLQTQRDVGLLVGIGLTVPLVAYLAGASFTTVRADYVFSSMPLAFVAAGYLCNELHRATRAFLLDPKHASLRQPPGIAAAVVSYSLPLIVIASLMPEFASHFTGRATLHMREPVQFVERVYTPGDRVLPLIDQANSFHYYADFNLAREPMLGNPLDPNVDWARQLQPYQQLEGCVWLVLPIRRQPLARSLEQWLIANARLVWRTTSKRFDYKVEGYQVFVASRDAERCVARSAASTRKRR